MYEIMNTWGQFYNKEIKEERKKKELKRPDGSVKTNSGRGAQVTF
jgi:hypothetical protein